MCPLDGIVAWNKERHLVTFDADAEHAMLVEELCEFYHGYATDSEHEMVDALCDIIVVATGAINKLGYDPKGALEETLKEINSRAGAYDKTAGKWKKDRNQDPATLYKADYTSARR